MNESSISQGKIHRAQRDLRKEVTKHPGIPVAKLFVSDPGFGKKLTFLVKHYNKRYLKNKWKSHQPKLLANEGRTTGGDPLATGFRVGATQSFRKTSPFYKPQNRMIDILGRIMIRQRIKDKSNKNIFNVRRKFYSGVKQGMSPERN